MTLIPTTVTVAASAVALETEALGKKIEFQPKSDNGGTTRVLYGGAVAHEFPASADPVDPWCVYAEGNGIQQDKFSIEGDAVGDVVYVVLHLG